MRMWGVNPKLMCDQHLLGEHLEMHMFIGCLKKGTSIKGYIDKGLVEVHMIIERHAELAKEMSRRGMNHDSPISEEDENLLFFAGFVNPKVTIRELCSRCKKCRMEV